MKKTFPALAAVTRLAGSLAATPASAQRGVAAAVSAGPNGGAILLGAVDSRRPGYGGAEIGVETGGLRMGAERRAGLHPRLAVELVLVEPDPRQMTLHRLDVLGAQLRRRRPRRCERQRTSHAVAEMADEQHIQIGE